MENYTPKIICDSNVIYLEMVVEAKKCHLCRKIMVSKTSRGLFPNYIDMNQKAQMKRAGLVYSSSTNVDGERICIECKDAGKADILCALCNERKPSDKEQESFGHPAEYLCTDCYETVPAKIWKEKEIELYNDHKYDLD